MIDSTSSIRAILDEAKQLAASYDNLFAATFDVYAAEFEADHAPTPQTLDDVVLKWNSLADSHTQMRQKLLQFSRSLADTLSVLARNSSSSTVVAFASKHVM